MRGLAAVFLLIAGGLPLPGQVSASLSGTIMDPSSAVIASATVTVKNTDTGFTRSTITDASGRYEVNALPVGEYEVRAQKANFSPAVRTGIRLVVAQRATVDLKLSVGGSAQEVTVNADAAPVSVTTADISGLVGPRQVQDLPLNGRSFDELLTLNPGVVNFTWEKTGGVGVSNSTAGNDLAVTGNWPQQNLYLLNGIELSVAAEMNIHPVGASQD